MKIYVVFISAVVVYKCFHLNDYLIKKNGRGPRPKQSIDTDMLSSNSGVIDAPGFLLVLGFALLHDLIIIVSFIQKNLIFMNIQKILAVIMFMLFVVISMHEYYKVHNIIQIAGGIFGMLLLIYLPLLQKKYG